MVYHYNPVQVGTELRLKRVKEAEVLDSAGVHDHNHHKYKSLPNRFICVYNIIPSCLVLIFSSHNSTIHSP